MDSETDHVKASSLKLGPKGLGDPDDLSLRRIEKVVKIPQKMRENARVYKCNEEVKKFDECCLEHGITLFYKCQGPNKALKECIARWFLDEDFRKECTKEYLEERSQYRRTGIPTKRYYRIPEVEKQ